MASSESNASVSSVPPGATMHHIGFVVASIDDIGDRFAQSIGGSWDRKIYDDPLQRVHVTFLRAGFDTDPLIELIEPATEQSPVDDFLKRGGGLHHICYEVENLDEQLALSRSRGALLVRKPVPAVAFGDRRIAWVYTKQKLLVEYLERRKPG